MARKKQSKNPKSPPIHITPQKGRSLSGSRTPHDSPSPKRAKRDKKENIKPAGPVQNEHGYIYGGGLPEGSGLEDVQRYRPGGLHPLHPGEFIDESERYEIFYKLGSGDNSTVWLCYDNEEYYWVAVKVLAADKSSEESPELVTMNLLADVPREELELNHIGTPLRHFWIEGPNGRHLCLVSEVYGSLGCIPPGGAGQHIPWVLDDLCLQLGEGIKYLHDKGICHGDIRFENLAMQVDLSEMSSDDLHKHLGEPYVWHIGTLSGEKPGPWGPEYLVEPVQWGKFEYRFGLGRLLLIDFGLSYPVTSPPKLGSQTWYRPNAAPELLFDLGHHGPPTDIWALACVFCELIGTGSIFSEYDSDVSLIRKMEWWFGPFPLQFKEGVHNRFDGYTDSKVRASVKVEKLASTTRSGRTYQKNATVVLGLSLEGYAESLLAYGKKTGWPHHLQSHLAYWMKMGLYWKDLVEGTGILDAEEETANESQSADHVEELPGVTTGLSERAPSPKKLLPPIPPFGGEYAKYLPQIYAKFVPSDEPIPVPYRLVNSDQGYWPSQENPCVCYLEENIAKFGPRYICGAIDHYRQPASSTTMFALTKDEVSMLSDLLLKMLEYSSKDRITIDEVLNHEYFDHAKWMFGDNSDVSEEEQSNLQAEDCSKQHTEEDSEHHTEDDNEHSDGETTQGSKT